MRPEEGPYLAHRQWNPFPGPLPREHAHFGPHREHRGLHGDLVRMRRDIVRQDEDRRLQLAHEARVHGCRPATSMVRCPEGEVTQAYARLARNEVWRLVARLRARWCKREGGTSNAALCRAKRGSQSCASTSRRRIPLTPASTGPRGATPACLPCEANALYEGWFLEGGRPRCAPPRCSSWRPREPNSVTACADSSRKLSNPVIRSTVSP